jgi:peptide/nickel transport system substrate-binding protein
MRRRTYGRLTPPRSVARATGIKGVDMSNLKHAKSIRFGSCVAVALVAGLTASACSGDGSNPAPAGSTISRTPGVAAGDVDKITWGLPLGEPRTVDPAYGLDYSPSLVTSQMCDTLLRSDANGALTPGLATSEQPDDLTLVYTLRGGATFWDGKPVTADDVAWSLQRSAAPESYLALMFENVDSITATGPDQVTVRLKKPDMLLNKEMASFSGSVMEKAWSEAAGDQLGTASKGVMCSGPFRFTSWTPGQSIVLTRNDRYWDPTYAAHAETLEFKFFSDSTALTQALLSGEIDGAYEIPPSEIDALSKATNGTLFAGDSRQYITLERRGDSGPLASKSLREALYRSIDREGIAQVVYSGTAQAAWAMVTPSSWDPEGKDVWAKAYEEYRNAGRMSVDDAKALVAESGYQGTPVVLSVLSGDATQNQLAQVIQQSASEIGVNVEIKTLQPTVYSDAMVDGRADAGDLMITPSFNITADPLEQIPYYVEPDSPYNYTKYEDPEVLALVDKARQTRDPKARAELLVQAQSKYEAEHEFTALVQKDEVMFLNNRLAGAPTTLDYLLEPSLALVGAST